ncbi:MAG: YecA family protein [Halomonadaceae bacterium]|nr:MAG: YecA family protein [Halomonadaceae bacterium]
MATDPAQGTLPEADIDALEVVLFDERWPEGAMDFFGFHGAVCASAIGPALASDAALFALVTAQEPGNAGPPPEIFIQSVAKLTRQVRQLLEQGESLQLPEPEDGNASDALENWCAGFVDTFLLTEDDWVADQEALVAEQLMPIMTLSNLFEDEDFQKARQDEKQAEQLADQIPDSLTDLYLLYHSP